MAGGPIHKEHAMIEPNPRPAGPDVTADDKLFSALSYIIAPWVSLLILLMDQTKERPYPRYHALQAVGFAVAVYVFEFVAAIVYCVGSAITFGVGALCL